jgi:trk system potassium uptake protein TrkA
VSLVAVRAFKGGPLVGHPISHLRTHMPQIDARVAAIFRDDRPIIPEGDTVVLAGDEVFFIADSRNIRKVLHELRRMDKPVKRVMIGGGGNIGRRLAKQIENALRREGDRVQQGGRAESRGRARPTLVLGGRRHRRGAPARGEHRRDGRLLRAHERRREQHHELAPRQAHGRAQGDRAHQPQLVREPRAVRRDRHRDFAAQATIGTLLARVRRGDCAPSFAAARRGGSARARSRTATAKSSKVVGRKIEELELPKGTTIGAVVRRRAVETGATTALAYDHAVLMAHHDSRHRARGPRDRLRREQAHGLAGREALSR